MDNEPNIQEVLESLGYKLIDHGNHWRTSALYRKGDNPNSVQVYKNSGVWHDFGAGRISQPFETLVKLSTGEEVDLTHIKTIDIAPEVLNDQFWPEETLSKFVPHFNFYTGGAKNRPPIKEGVLKRLRCGMCMEGKMYQRLVFPVFDSLGRICGLAGRDLTNKKTAKWKLLGKKTKWLFPLFCLDDSGQPFVLKEIERTKTVYLVESVGDVLAFHNRGIFNVLCIFGLRVSDSIICKLVELDPDNIFICLNNDTSKANNFGFASSVENFLRLVEHFSVGQLKICLPTKGDFGEMREDDWVGWEKKKKSIDYDHQVEVICEKTDQFLHDGLITKRCYENFKLLDCL